jgi:hypothetical protein
MHLGLVHLIAFLKWNIFRKRGTLSINVFF